MAWYYLSDFGGIGTRDFPFQPHAFPLITAAGGQGACFDLRTDCSKVAGFAVVASTVQLTSPPAGVTLLFDDSTLDTILQAGIAQAINTNLGIVLANLLTGRGVLKALATKHGVGAWGVVHPDTAGALHLHFGGAGSVPLH